MYSKIQIEGTIEVMTGMHIGTSDAFAAIGAIDAPVIRDARTNLPMLPGSSLKGKMRTLLARKYNEKIVQHAEDDERILRLFGSAKKGNVKPSRILFTDMVMANADELEQYGVQSKTEVKFENTINRQTAVANPRQIERVIRGTKFTLDLVYEVNAEDNKEELQKDMELLAEGMELLQYDYIGGHGSRGYGKIRFQDVQAKLLIGQVDDGDMADINERFAKI